MITASTLPNSETSTDEKHDPREIRVRVLRQDAPGEESYWEQFAIPYEPNMNVISVSFLLSLICVGFFLYLFQHPEGHETVHFGEE